MLRCDLMRGGSEGGEAATSHKGLVFSVVKALPLNQRDSRYFYSVIFPCPSPSCFSKQTPQDFSFSSSLAAHPSVIFLVLFCL